MKLAVRRLLFLSIILCCARLYASGTEEVPSILSGKASQPLSKGAVTAAASLDESPSYTHVIKTDYFDIIYPDQSERTAFILAERADALYEKAAALLETTPWMHIPVVVSPSTQQINAYYTASPYNHIVILDTPNDNTELAVFTETVVSIFYHELIHAITANIHKNQIWDFANPFGDFYSLSFLVNSKLFSLEGATVSLESLEGEGRVNNGDTMAYLIQAKLEGKFPSWRDVSGPRDIYPSQKSSYLYGGAFFSWLEETFGMQTYADFWKECSTIHLTGFTGIFRKVYGITIDEAWELFTRIVPEPEMESEEILTGIDSDSSFSTLTVRPGSQEGIVYVKNGCSVVYRKVKDGVTGKEQELFTCYGAPSQLSFSSNGRYLAVSGTLSGSAEAQSVRIYDMAGGSFTGAEIPYARSAVITEGTDGRQCVFCVVSAGSYEIAAVYALDDVLSSASDALQPLFLMELPVFDEIYGTAPVPGGAACLRKTDGLWYLTEAQTDGTLENWELPEDIIPLTIATDYPHTENGTVSLLVAVTSKGMNAGSESEPGALSRLAEITIADGKAFYSFQKKAFSGGVHFPASDGSGNVYGINRLSEWYRVTSWNRNDSEMTVPCELEKAGAVSGKYGTKGYTASFKPEKYRPLSYMWRGTLFPLSGMLLSPLAPSFENYAGATWWTENPQETVNIELSASFPVNDGDPLELYGTVFGKESRLVGGTFYWDLGAILDLDGDYNFQQFTGRLALGEAVPLSNPGEQFTVTDVAVVVIRKARSAEEPFFIIADNLSAGYSRQTKKGMNQAAVQGFNFGVNFYVEYDVTHEVYFNVSHNQPMNSEYTYASPGVSAGFKLARLLPLPYDPKLTFNLPLSVSASLCGTPSTFLTADASVTVFSAEIQKGLPAVPFYCNRFIVNAGWSFKNGAPSGYRFNSWSIFNSRTLFESFSSLDTMESINAGMNFVISPDIGTTYSVHFNLGINGKYYLRNDYSDKKYEVSLLGVFKF